MALKDKVLPPADGSPGCVATLIFPSNQLFFKVFVHPHKLL